MKSHLLLEPNDTNNTVGDDVDTLVREVTKERNAAGFSRRRNVVPLKWRICIRRKSAGDRETRRRERRKSGGIIKAKYQSDISIARYYIIQSCDIVLDAEDHRNFNDSKYARPRARRLNALVPGDTVISTGEETRTGEKPEIYVPHTMYLGNDR